MPAAYDHYDYPSYWKHREYEHLSEKYVVQELLKEIDKFSYVLEIGGGFGRLIPSYLYRADKIVFSDPSAKLLKIAREKFVSKKIKFIQAKLETLPEMYHPSSFDLILMIRVLHHIENLDKAFGIINKLLKEKGYFILEFANKNHFKAVLKNMLIGDFTFPFDIFPKDRRSKKSIRENTLPFINYHPDFIQERLEANGFTIVKKYSVSNIRSPFLKKILPTHLLLSIEKRLQKLLSGALIGPSVFLLIQKKG